MTRMRQLAVFLLLALPVFAQYPNTTLTVSTASLNLGTTLYSATNMYGAPTLDQTVEIVNTGLTNNLWVSSLAITGTNAADFHEYDSCGAPNRIFVPPNSGFCDIHVWFTPSTTSSESATLTLVANDSGSPHTVSLSGTGVAPNHTYYINPNGSDSHTCLAPGAGSSCQTPQKAESIVVAGDLVCVAIGSYYLPDIASAPYTYVLSASGTSGQPIVFAACTNQAVVFSGSHSATALQGTFVTGGAGALSCGTNCTDYYTHLTSPTLFDDLWYNNSATTSGRRFEPVTNNKNNTTPQGDTNVCVAGTTTAQTNTLCGCPSGGINGSNCFLQATPCPPPSAPSNVNYCFNKMEYKNTDILPSPHAAAIGAIKLKPVADWTMETDPLCYPGNTTTTCPAPSNGVAYLTGPGYLDNGSGGFIPGRDYLQVNRAEDASCGSWYLDQCPGCSATNGTPASTQNLHIFACTGETPNTATIQYSAIVGPGGHVMSGSGVSWRVFDGITLEMGNYYVYPYPNQESQGQPLISADASFTSMNDIVWHRMVVRHSTGKCMEILGTSASWTLADGGFYDCGAGGLFVGAIGTTSDTNSSVPASGTVMNEYLLDSGEMYPSGEATGISHENGHGWTYLHNDCLGPYAGCFGEGHFLNVGSSGTLNSGFIYGNKWLWNTAAGRFLPSTGVTVSYCCADYGLAYSAANHSSMCPTPDSTIQPSNILAYCNWDIGFKAHDAGSNWQALVHGSDCDYKDQGSTHVFVYQLLGYRCADDIVYMNRASNPALNTNTAAQYAYQWNFIGNSLLLYGGAVEYSVPIYKFPSQGRTIGSGAAGIGLHWWQMSSSIIVSNGYFGNTVQAFPANWEGIDYSQVNITSAGSGGTPNATFSITFTGGGCTIEPQIQGINNSSGSLVGSHLQISGTFCATVPTPDFSAGGFTSSPPTLTLTLGAGTFAGGLIAGSPVAVSDLTEIWKDQSNDIWDIARAPLTFFYCPFSIPQNQVRSTACRLFPQYYNVFPGPIFPWLGMEGLGNQALDPGIPCAHFGGCGSLPESHMPTNVYLMSKIGFTPWDESYSGRIDTTQVPAWVQAPNFFGTSTIINAMTDYDCQNYNSSAEPGTCTTPYVPTGPVQNLTGTISGGTWR